MTRIDLRLRWRLTKRNNASEPHASENDRCEFFGRWPNMPQRTWSQWELGLIITLDNSLAGCRPKRLLGNTLVSIDVEDASTRLSMSARMN